jgi:Alw26I/Eco31I/Esp3I family type II restriction m6 adenine DNA methyltransferase
LRKWTLQQTDIRSIDHYPAEAKPFEKVDQPCVFTILQRSVHPVPIQPIITRHDRALKEIASECIHLTDAELKTLEFRIPTELTAGELALLLKLSRFRPLSDWEVSRGGTLWMGRELDETNYRSFVSSVGEVAFAKGRDVNRFARIGPLRDFVKANAKEIPKSSYFQRVTWRDVSRRSQARRMVATLIPPGVATGNSLHVAYFIDEDPRRLEALLGVLNSLAFEFQLRSRLGTGHISLGSVRGVHVPDLNDPLFIRRISQFTKRALSGDLTAEIQIEATIADALSLSQAERDTLVNHFTGLQPQFSSELRRTLNPRVNGKEKRR